MNPDGRRDSATLVLPLLTAADHLHPGTDCKGDPADQPSPAFAIWLDDFETRPVSKEAKIEVRNIWGEMRRSW